MWNVGRAPARGRVYEVTVSTVLNPDASHLNDYKVSVEHYNADASSFKSTQEASASFYAFKQVHARVELLSDGRCQEWTDTPIPGRVYA